MDSAEVTLLPLQVCKAPAASVLTYTPSLGAVTFTVTVQNPWAVIEPPVKMSFELPVLAETIPPQVETKKLFLGRKLPNY